MVAHQGLWHCGQPNSTDRDRIMFKVRLNPTVPQIRLWNHDNVDDVDAFHDTLLRNHGWYGNEYRIEWFNRLRFWRYLTDDATFDLDYWLGRLEVVNDAVALSDEGARRSAF
jgi:hypothetical protein